MPRPRPSPDQPHTARPRPHTACLGDDVAYPRLPRQVWFRVVSLLYYRASVSPVAMRMARHVSQHADAGGYLRDVEEVILGYCALHGVSRRSAYKDLGALGLTGAGMVRQTRAPAPGRTARYQLCAPSRLPDDLPEDLAAVLRRTWHRPQVEEEPQEAETRTPEQRLVTPQRPRRRLGDGVAGWHRILAAVPMWSYGSAHCAYRQEEFFHGWVHTSPFSKRVPSHPSTPSSFEGHSPEHQPAQGMNTDEKTLAEEVLTKAWPRWKQQRGPAGVPGCDELARLLPLVRGALRYLCTPDVVETITDRVGSACHLPSVLASRLRRVITNGRRLYNVNVDDVGERYAAMLDELGRLGDMFRRSEQAQAAIAAERERQEHARRAAALRRQTEEQPPRLVEDEQQFAIELAEIQRQHAHEQHRQAERERRARLAARLAEERHQQPAAAPPPAEPATAPSSDDAAEEWARAVEERRQRAAVANPAF